MKSDQKIDKIISDLEFKFVIAMQKSMEDGDPKHRLAVISNAKKEIEQLFESEVEQRVLEIVGEDEYSGQFATSDPREEYYIGRDDLRAELRKKVAHLEPNNRKDSDE